MVDFRGFHTQITLTASLFLKIFIAAPIGLAQVKALKTGFSFSVSIPLLTLFLRFALPCLEKGLNFFIAPLALDANLAALLTPSANAFLGFFINAIAV